MSTARAVGASFKRKPVTVQKSEAQAGDCPKVLKKSLMEVGNICNEYPDLTYPPKFPAERGNSDVKEIHNGNVEVICIKTTWEKA